MERVGRPRWSFRPHGVVAAGVAVNSIAQVRRKKWMVGVHCFVALVAAAAGAWQALSLPVRDAVKLHIAG